jgi:hypothetical protein
MRSPARTLLPGLALALLLAGTAGAQVCNVKVVTDASPDYSDLPSLVHSVTANRKTTEEKCWAVFYWNHVARRQTNPIWLHGLACTDPIRQFNDYGYTMCSTVAGINQSLWEAMGLRHRYWDISNHTVAEVFYDGRWHMYDNSMSALYTLCDGHTLAGVEDIGKPGACAASGGKVEPGHIARYHCLTATSPRGFLTGADCSRSLDEEARCFNPKGLKLRTYYHDWDHGHRYILNLRNGEVYTRTYHSLGDAPGFYVPNQDGKDPEKVNPRYHLRGNGVWTFRPRLTPADYAWAVHSAAHVRAREPAGLAADAAGTPAEIVFKVQSANVTTSQTITAAFRRRSADDRISVAVSTTNGLTWKEVWEADGTGQVPARIRLVEEVNGAYETLIRVRLLARNDPADAVLEALEVQTTTALNAKTQPRLNLGRNTVHVGAGGQTDSIVLWPELQAGRHKDLAVEARNVQSVPRHLGYQGAVYPAKAREDAYLVYRLDAPADLRHVTYGGRFYNRAPRSHIDLLHSFDGGKTWARSWSLSDTAQPWDVIHYETVPAPPGCRSVLLKYLMNTTDPSSAGCSIYALRIEGAHAPADPGFRPLEVTFRWKERQADHSLLERAHTQLVERVPCTYTVNVGGADHPVMESLTVNLKGARGPAAYGYSDGRDVGGGPRVGRWVSYGRNLALGKPYTCSAPSLTNWGAGDPDGKKLTDGIVGPSYAGGTSYRTGALWDAKAAPVIDLDLGEPVACASFGMNFHGYPFCDALKGEVKDAIEVWTSTDGRTYARQGTLPTDLRLKDIPVNFLLPDDETLTGYTFRLIPDKPVTARHVRYKITTRRLLCVTELEVLDAIRFKPFDLRVALPGVE